MFDAKFLERRNRENLVEMYREELLRMAEGDNCIKLIPGKTRKRFREDGVLNKFGNRYEVTPLGRKMLEAGRV